MSTRQRRRNRAGDPAVWMSGIIAGNWDPHKRVKAVLAESRKQMLNSSLRYSSCG